MLCSPYELQASCTPSIKWCWHHLSPHKNTLRLHRCSCCNHVCVFSAFDVADHIPVKHIGKLLSTQIMGRSILVLHAGSNLRKCKQPSSMCSLCMQEAYGRIKLCSTMIQDHFIPCYSANMQTAMELYIRYSKQDA